MADIVVNGNTSGAVTLSAPAVAGTVTVTLPAASGTMLTTASSTGVSGSAISSGTVAEAYGGTGTSTGYYGFKNRIINGAMVIDQRNAGASVSTASGAAAYTIDRFKIDYSQTSKFTLQQNAGSVTPPVGFGNYLGVTSSSAYSVLAGDYFQISQAIEGFNTSDLAWGTANAATVTLSFWVRSSLTGTFGGALQNSAVNRSYPYSYTISAANTWEQKTITIAGDTSGTWIGATNGIGLAVSFNLGMGSTRSGTANAWASANYLAPTGATSVVGTNGATFYITGVQLEKGSTATSFDYRPYTTELQLCQRYYNRWSGANSPNIGLATALLTGGTAPSARRATWANPVDFRSQPTMGSGGTIQFYTAGLTNLQFSSFNGTQSNKNIISIDINSASAGTVGQSGMLIIDSSSAANFIDASAEL